MDASTQTQDAGNRSGLSFDTLVQEVIGILDRQAVMALATSAGGRVTARSMSVIHAGLTVYFQTATDSDKYQQLAANPNVALCGSNLQMEGRAQDLGHPLSQHNRFFADAYSQRHPGSFRAYSGLSFNRVIAVTPVRAVLWKYDPEGKPYRDFLDLENKRTRREFYPLEG